MRYCKSIQGVVVAMAAAGLFACARAGGGGRESAEASGSGISIQVTNDLIPGTSIVVWVVPEVGNRQRLGPVPPNGRRSFQYSPRLETEIYLVAVPEGPASGTMGPVSERRSTPFPVTRVQSVTWSVSAMNVRIGG